MKKNFRKIPPSITLKLGRLTGQEIVAGCSLSIDRAKIMSGDYSHLGISLGPGGLQFSEEVLPLTTQGKYSYRNIHGKTLVRRDLEKVRRTRSMDVPNWRGYGTHEVDIQYYAYPRDFLPPRGVKLVIHCSNPGPQETKYVFAVKVDEVLSRADAGFEDNLLYDINILQENVGACGVELSSVQIASTSLPC